MDDPARILRACCSLEKLSMGSMDFKASLYIPAIIRNSSTLKILDLTYCKGLNLYRIKRIFSACQELKEVSFEGIEQLCPHSISFICNNLSKSIEKINLRNQKVYDNHLNNLVSRCKNIVELDLRQTLITEISLDPIIENLSESLESLVWNGNPVDVMKLEQLKRLKYFHCFKKKSKQRKRKSSLSNELDKSKYDHSLKLFLSQQNQ